MKPVRVGIIGFGRIGAEHAGWIARSGTCEVCAVADPTDARRARAEAEGLVAVPSTEELLRRDDIDAVLVANPTSMHFDTAMSVLAAGKGVMIEKPVTLNLEQAQRLLDESAHRRGVISVFHNRRWDIDFRTVAQAIRAEVLGRIINVESRLGQWASCVGPAAREYRPNWRNEAAFGGGGWYDWGSHLVDQMWRLMLPARPTTVFAQLRGNVWSADCDDFARVCINFDSGAVGLVEINTTTTRPLPRWHLDGTGGSAESPHSPEFDTRRWAQLTIHPGDGGAAHIAPLAAKGLDEAEIWRRFGVAVREGGEPAVTLRSVLPTMALLDAARESSKRQAAVEVEHRIFE